MKKSFLSGLTMGVLVTVFASCTSVTPTAVKNIFPYAPDDAALFKTIAAMDSVYFTAYNNCDMATQADLYADNIEFYHDRGGLLTSKTELLASIEKNICGKVTRTLVKESLEVYPIKDFGAVEIGYHTFFNNQEPNAPSTPSKFIMLWQLKDGKWKITKVVSLH